MPALPTYFFEKTRISDGYPFLDRLAHIVESEGGDRHSRQRLHLHARLRFGTDNSLNSHTGRGDFDHNVYMRQRQWMAQWD